MRKLQILMPMGGLGSRFSDAGYNTPKPLINVDGIPMFMKAISSLNDLKAKKDLIFVIRKEHAENQNLDNLILKNAPKAKIVIIPKLTRGAAETAFAAKDILSPDDGLIIMDCDLWFNSNSYNEMISSSLSNKIKIDGGLLTFKSENPRYSYAKINKNNLVINTAEKEVISNNAITGAYYFNRASDFIESASNLIKRPISDNLKEYYISYLFKDMVNNGKKIKATYIDKFESFGTPEELENYEIKSAALGGVTSYITDLDGTLCDTLEANLLSYKNAFFDTGIVFDEAAYRNNFGLRFEEMMETIAPNAGKDQINNIKTQKAIYYKEHLDYIKPNYDLISFLTRAKKRGSKIAIVTTARRENASAVIGQLGLNDFFNVSVFGEDVLNGKPNPECYNIAIKKLEKKPEECLIFEDSKTGVIAAKASGAKVMVINI